MSKKPNGDARKAAKVAAKQTARSAPEASPDEGKMLPPKARSLIAAFRADPPAEVAVGHYTFCVRDRWYGHKVGVLDGWNTDGTWSIRIKGGAPAEAIRADWPQDRPTGQIHSGS